MRDGKKCLSSNPIYLTTLFFAGEDSNVKQHGEALAMSNGSDGSDADLGEGELKQSSGDEAGLIKTKMGSPNKQSADPGLTNGYDTFKKKRSIQGGTAETKEQIIDFIEQEPLFDHQEHRMQIMDVIRNYVKEARRKEILVILDNRVFDEEGNVEEVAAIMNKFVRVKTNNNDM